ncbi:hybrid sensor histidine kinase/response regulator [Lichenihabitans psoromatis]|uniref:hybrid sensor histidine kinase/response regulator n=1 Tax=Lichenihabitans psoromatis TaxID=2528642 RepID=UPI001036F200|nr:hybrid sensor histidine kinase/response regulator [Lichenihabitans psoromatis]
MTSPTRILLIDDDAVDRASVRRALNKSGLSHDLIEAADGTTGLLIAAQQNFDCVLLDYRLPDIDAFEVLQALLSPEGGNHAVLMLTGETDEELALRLMRAGALDYLAKSEATPSILARAIRYARARRGFLAELETARREAETKSIALDTLNRQKTLLFSIIAHDLRNPFQALLGLSEVLSKAATTKDTAAVERRAQGLHQAAGQAYALMESLFAWASLQMETTAVDLDAVLLDDVARETLAGAAAAAAAKTVALTHDCSGLVVEAQRDMLLAVLRNLVGNAIKFTHVGGSVAVSARLDGGAITISVADTGVGMSPDKLADLFRLDRRVSTKGTAGERGSGLGLLLCRDLMERQGGSLSVESEVDRGTTFHLTLAAASQLAEPVAIAEET